jgi:hypothetical protein
MAELVLGTQEPKWAHVFFTKLFCAMSLLFEISSFRILLAS